MKKFNKEEELLNFIKEHQEEYGYPPTVREMCRAIKVSSTSTISYYLNKLEGSGQIKKSPNKNRALEIVGDDEPDNIINFANYTRIPMVGKITAGEPILAIENTEEYFLASPSLFRGEGLFILTVSGESMINAGIYDGDKIIVKVNHVMEEDHYIEWISVVSDNEEITKYFKI